MIRLSPPAHVRCCRYPCLEECEDDRRQVQHYLGGWIPSTLSVWYIGKPNDNTGAGGDNGIDHNKNRLRFPYDNSSAPATSGQQMNWARVATTLSGHTVCRILAFRRAAWHPPRSRRATTRVWHRCVWCGSDGRWYTAQGFSLPWPRRWWLSCCRILGKSSSTS
jgi:hypothetical protein